MPPPRLRLSAISRCLRFSPHPCALPPLSRRLTTAAPTAPNSTTTSALGTLQKDLKKALKHRPNSSQSDDLFAPTSAYQITCGLEVHAQLHTTHKLFSPSSACGASTLTAGSNTALSPIDAALPGTQPTFNPAVLLPALRAALALNCDIAPSSRFDRKHYFYHDQPAGYQLTQFYAPLARNGALQLTPDAPPIPVVQLQLEQDTGKTLAAPPHSLVDLNRVGTPLIELITAPFPLTHATHAGEVLAHVQALLNAVDACTLGMEWGGLRADVNVSVAPRGGAALGQRCEIKNLASFAAVNAAVRAEAARQIAIVSAGGTVRGETRGWDAERHTTRRLRGKEGEVDYRYMPEPDLAPVIIPAAVVAAVRAGLPALPAEVQAELERDYGLSAKDAATLLALDGNRTATPESVTRYYKAVCAPLPGTPAARRAAGNWVLHELGGLLKTVGWGANPVSAEEMGALLSLLLGGRVAGSTAKGLLARMVAGEVVDVAATVEAEGLGMVEVGEEELRQVVEGVLREGRGVDVARQLKAGGEGKAWEKKKRGLRGWVLGAVMREMGGRVDGARVEEAVGGVLAEMEGGEK
ncbi:GatB/GatE catalytic domain-containing protein [Geopyxis carbonaria]|nr:GatB/GatE catalytic domain-containing protein [Geopyxis carbonaria]